MKINIIWKLLDEYIYNLPKYYTMMELMFLKELMSIKQVHQKSVIFVIIGIY